MITPISLTIEGYPEAPAGTAAVSLHSLRGGPHIITGTLELDPTARARIARYAFQVWYRACRTIRKRDAATMFMADFGRCVFRIGYQTYPNGLTVPYEAATMVRAGLCQYLGQAWRPSGRQYRRLVIAELRRARLAVGKTD